MSGTDSGFIDRVVLVTGGSAGIGRACAERMRDLGALVSVLDRDLPRPRDRLEDVAYFQGDVSVDADVDRVVTAVGSAAGRIDVLVNNAGVSAVGTIEDGALADWNRIWDINVLGYVRTIRAALPLLRASRSPSIVNMASCTAESGFKRRAAYSATKGAIVAMSRAIAADLIEEGICVNAVSPGTVDTPFMAALMAKADDPSAVREQYDARQPSGRMVRPDEVARAVAYLADAGNRSSVGTLITVDGGIAALHITDV